VIMRDNECYSGVRPEKGHLTQEVKVANEITCNHVRDKLYAPISVTCSKWYIRKAPFVLGAQSLNENLYNKLAS
jgi:hypothetical protein